MSQGGGTGPGSTRGSTRVSTRGSIRGARRWRRATALAVSAGCGLATLAAAPVAAGLRADAPGDRGEVCGGLAADPGFAREASALGVSHACDHLEGRLFRGGAHAGQTERGQRAAGALATTDPAVVGRWSDAVNPGTKTVGITAVLLHTGKVLLFGGKYASTEKNTAAYLYDPVTRTGHEVPAPAAVFCGGVTILADGRVFSSGGASPVPKGIVDQYLFDPRSERWLRQPDTPLGRYYPTTTKLSDGRVVIAAGSELSGSTPNRTVELFTPPAPGEATGTLQRVGPDHVSKFYPLQWAMNDRNVFQTDGLRTWRLDTGTWSWNRLAPPLSPQGAGSAGLMLAGGPNGSSKVMVVGGILRGTAHARTQLFDYANPASGWSYQTPLPTPRSHMNLVQVPDGSAFGIGGNSSELYNVGQTQTMSYDPRSDTWTNLAVQSVRRAYHSTAVLLPDGRIMSAGDGGAGGGRQRIDFYSPPYLFQGPRPRIDTAPAQVSHGDAFAVDLSGPAASRLVLMAPAATTHANEMHARHVELAVTSTPTGFEATAPTARVAPPGHYMLFAVTEDGVPSVADWVHVGA